MNSGTSLFLLKLIWVGVPSFATKTVQMVQEAKKKNQEKNGFSLTQG